MGALQRGEEFIQEFESTAAKILHGGMEINGVHRHDRGDLALEASLGTADARIEGEFWIYGRLKFHGTVTLQHSMLIEMRRDGGARTILRGADSNVRPWPVRIVGRAVARSARRARQRGKHFGEVADSLANQITLSLSRKESIVRQSFGIPVLIADPGHTPVDVRRAGFPQCSQKVSAVAGVREITFHRRAAEMCSTVQRGIKET